MVRTEIQNLEDKVAQEDQEVEAVLNQLRHQRVGLVANHLIVSNPHLVAGSVSIMKHLSGSTFMNSSPTSTKPTLITH